MANEQNLKPRVTEYDSDVHDDEAYAYCLLGHTLKDLANDFGVSLATIKRWKKENPSFRAAVYRGCALADARVAEGLYKRATGFEVDSEKHFVVATGDYTSKVETIATKTYYPPDPGAAMNWLKNRQPDTWRDKVDIGLPPIFKLTMNMDDEEEKQQTTDEE